MNNHAIELEKNKHQFFRPIYNLKLVELEILKMYIQTSLATDFIQSFKSLAKELIFFDWKSDSSF